MTLPAEEGTHALRTEVVRYIRKKAPGSTKITLLLAHGVSFCKSPKDFECNIFLKIFTYSKRIMGADDLTSP